MGSAKCFGMADMASSFLSPSTLYHYRLKLLHMQAVGANRVYGVQLPQLPLGVWQ